MESITLSIAKIRTAPPAVRQWFCDQFYQTKMQIENAGGPPQPEPTSTPEKVEPEPVEDKKPEAEMLGIDVALQVAAKLIEEKGADHVKPLLEKFGIRRVRECPDERVAELLEVLNHA